MTDRIDTDAIRHRWVGNRDVMGLCDEVDRLRALAAPVDPADVRAEGRRLLAESDGGKAGLFSATDAQWIAQLELQRLLRDHADVLLADPAPVGLTEDEQATVMRIGEKHNWPGGYMQHDFAALLAIIDRLSAAPVDDRERVPEGWRVEWRSCSPLVCDNPEHKSTPVLVPVFPPADPEENPDD